MKKIILSLLLASSFFSLVSFADDDYSYDSYNNYDYSYDDYSYDTYDVYDVYDSYDIYDTSSSYSYTPSYSSSSSSSSSYSPQYSHYTCPTFNTPSSKEGCSIERNVDIKGCTYPTQTCKKIEAPKCPTHSKPTYGKGCTQTWQTDSQGCYYLTETCSAIQKPQQNLCSGKHSLPTFAIGCTQTWQQDSEGCYYLVQDCSSKNSSNNSSNNSHHTSHSYHDDEDGYYYYDYHTNSYKYVYRDGYGYGNNKYYYDGRWRYYNYQPSVISVHGQKKVNTADMCSNESVQICGKKKVDISDYSKFGTKNIEQYTEVTYTSECDLESHGAEYLYPGECRSYDTCPLYKVTPEKGCTTTRKTSADGCQYPKQVCISSGTNSSTKSKIKTTSSQGTDLYWFDGVFK